MFAPVFSSDRRGNRISASEVYHVVGDESGEARIIDVCTSDDVVEHIKRIVPGRCTSHPPPAEGPQQFTHRLYMPDGPGAANEHAVSLLSEVITLRVPGVDVGVALDWYKIPPTADEDWRNTELGELRSRAKFWLGSPGEMAQARNELTFRLAAFVRVHPVFRNADALVTSPGHDRSKVSCGESLAKRLAVELGRDLVETETVHEVRPEAKSGAAVDLEDEFVMPRSLSDLSVIIVDDTLQSGETMRCVARTVRRAGASTVLGLVPVRNMRGS